MKTSITKGFQPITIAFTLETEEEAKVFQHIFGCGSISQDCTLRAQVQQMADKIFVAMSPYEITRMKGKQA